MVHLTVDAEEQGRRLDNFLLGRLKGLPRTRVYRLIRSGEVRVNGGRSRAAARLAAGDTVRVPPYRGGDEQTTRPALKPGQLDWIRQLIRYQDEDLLVLCKPAGLAVHGGSGISMGAIELLRTLIGPPAQLELVHRLDRETSGCLLVARRRSALRQLHAQFRAGSVAKRYQALLLGDYRPEGGSEVVRAPLLTSERRGGERHVKVAPEGKPAETRFQCRQHFGRATLVDVDLKTGRTHQIRVHAASTGHPVAGDPRYGPEDDQFAAAAGLRRLFLHAGELGFTHPRSGKLLTISCPLPAELVAVLDRLAAARPPASGR